MNKKKDVLLIIFLFLLAFLPRLFNLDQFIAADERRWVSNVNNFVMGLARRDFKETYQQYHPGVTTMWLSGLTARFDSWPAYKLPIVISLSLGVVLFYYLGSLLYGKKISFLASSLFALSPFFIAHSRVLAMDALLTLFMILALVSFFVFRKRGEWRYLIYAGILAGLAFLSKIPGAFILGFIVLVILYDLIRGKYKVKKGAKITAVLIGIFFVTIFILWPALWVAPRTVYQNIKSFFVSSEYQEIHVADKQFYYLEALAYNLTPVTAVLLILFVINLFFKKFRKIKNFDFLIFLLVFVVLFTAFLSLSPKKGERYNLPSWPAIIILSSFSLWYFSKIFPYKKSLIFFIMAAILIQASFSLFLHPYYLAHYNRLLPKPLKRAMGWGEGLDQAAEYLNQKERPESLKVASYYPNEFKESFKGEAVSLLHRDDPRVSYVILYKNMLERGDSWETDVLGEYKGKTPEKIIELNGLSYVWIYKKVNN